MIASLFTVPLLVWAFFQPLYASIAYLALAGLLELFVYVTRHSYAIKLNNPKPAAAAVQRYSLFMNQPVACRELKRSFFIIRIATVLLIGWLAFHQLWLLMGLADTAHLNASYLESIATPVPYLAHRARRGDEQAAFDFEELRKAVARITAGETYEQVVRSLNDSFFPSFEEMQSPDFVAWAEQDLAAFKQKILERQQRMEQDREAANPSQRVLLATDNAGLRQYVQDELQEAGCRVDTATSTDEALGLIVEQRYAVVVCTWSTLGINAGRLADTLKTMESETRVVILAGEHLRHEPSFNSIKAVDFLFTPLREGQVADSVMKAVA